MSTYLERQILWFEGIEAEMNRSESLRHKAILRTYMSHAAWELVGRADKLLGSDLMVDDPCYIIYGLGAPELRTYQGKDAIRKRFYDNLNEGLVLVYDEIRTVSDWGLSMLATVSQIVDGTALSGSDHDDIDPAGRYILEHRCAERWPFDEHARVAGEEVYQVGDVQITRVDATDDVTIKERNDAITRFLPVGALSMA